MQKSRTPESSGGSSSTTGPTPCEAISAFAPQSRTMYSISAAVSLVEMQV
jgi:hypothetical protein